MIPKETIEKILQAAKIEEVATDFYTFNKTGQSLYTECPKCGKKGKAKGLIITPAKQIFKCFSCDFSGKSSVDFLMEPKTNHIPKPLNT